MTNELSPAYRPIMPSGWTEDDKARLLTCQIVHDLISGRQPGLRIATMFSLSHDEVAYVAGPVRIDAFTSAGDGSYLHTSGFVVSTGAFGLALLPLSLAANAAMNARRRSQAAAAAAVAFRPIFSGSLYVTSKGFVLCGPQGLWRWDMAAIDGMQVIDANLVVMQGQSDGGPVTWQIIAPWAQLLFAMWALRHCPGHPQLSDGSWLRGEWLQYARSRGFDPRLISTVLA